ncbi:EutN/CcmL family microcompartment protein [Desulfosediminicola flagellatus]|uniref:EutN/CcmL family microcompartment protein n=1 Tax=Desulfosediminicola flagellatus TaxID=2569541 RepID=UPI0010AC3B2C|nr:EutN/CcmL family microcompartment protein [Desulfosediminicola flagellatus]
MIICKVVGNVWATRKEETLNGLKLMIVRRTDLNTDEEHETFVAVDCVGAGMGEPVLVVTGSSARMAMRNQNSPVDAAIVGIIDGSES